MIKNEDIKKRAIIQKDKDKEEEKKDERQRKIVTK